MKYFKHSLILLTFLTAFNSSFSQMDFNAMEANAGNATMDQNFCLTLDITEPLVDIYMFDISTLGFADNDAATKKFNRISNNLISYVADYDNNRGFARVYSDRIPDGETASVVWWNNYLINLCNQQ